MSGACGKGKKEPHDFHVIKGMHFQSGVPGLGEFRFKVLLENILNSINLREKRCCALRD